MNPIPCFFGFLIVAIVGAVGGLFHVFSKPLAELLVWSPVIVVFAWFIFAAFIEKDKKGAK